MIKKYKDWLTVNGISNATIVAYTQRIEEFLKDVSIDNINEETIVNYLLKLKGNFSPSTTNGYRCAIKSFLEFLKKNISVPKQLKIEEKLPEFITRKMFEEEVVKTAECFCPNPLRAKAILYFLFFTGIRESELLALRRKNINLEDRTAKIHNKKGKREKLIVFTEKVRDIINTYFSVEPEKNNAFNISDKGMEYMFQVLKPFFKDVNMHPHLLRHSYATYLRSKDFSIEDIKELLGHKSIQSTMRYAHADIDKIKEKYDKKIK